MHVLGFREFVENTKRMVVFKVRHTARSERERESAAGDI